MTESDFNLPKSTVFALPSSQSAYQSPRVSKKRTTDQYRKRGMESTLGASDAKYLEEKSMRFTQESESTKKTKW